jgi:hypothetical protein
VCSPPPTHTHTPTHIHTPRVRWWSLFPASLHATVSLSLQAALQAEAQQKLDELIISTKQESAKQTEDRVKVRLQLLYLGAHPGVCGCPTSRAPSWGGGCLHAFDPLHPSSTLASPRPVALGLSGVGCPSWQGGGIDNRAAGPLGV